MSPPSVKIKYTSRFVKKLRRLPQNIINLAAKKEQIFKVNPHSPNLKTHLLTGKLQGYHAFSVNFHIRIMFKFTNEREVIFFDIGSHSIYK